MTVHPAIEAQLKPDERILWTGRPDPGARLSYWVRYVQGFGWFMLAIALFFGLIGWANRGELGEDGAMGILATFFLGAMATAVSFIWILPAYYRANRRRTHYAATDRRALIVDGPRHRRVRSHDIADMGRIENREIGPDHRSVLYLFPPGGLARERAQHPPIGFEWLATADADAAFAAIKSVVDGMKSTPDRSVRSSRRRQVSR